MSLWCICSKLTGLVIQGTTGLCLYKDYLTHPGNSSHTAPSTWIHPNKMKAESYGSHASFSAWSLPYSSGWCEPLLVRQNWWSDSPIHARWQELIGSHHCKQPIHLLCRAWHGHWLLGAVLQHPLQILSPCILVPETGWCHTSQTPIHFLWLVDPGDSKGVQV